MNRDPLGPALKAFQAVGQRYRSQVDETRVGWNDEARRVFDDRFGQPIDKGLKRAAMSLATAQGLLQQAVSDASSAADEIARL